MELGTTGSFLEMVSDSSFYDAQAANANLSAVSIRFREIDERHLKVAAAHDMSQIRRSLIRYVKTDARLGQDFADRLLHVLSPVIKDVVDLELCAPWLVQSQASIFGGNFG